MSDHHQSREQKLMCSPGVQLCSVSVLLMDLAEVSRGGAASGQAIQQTHRWEHALALAQACGLLLLLVCQNRTLVKIYKKEKSTRAHTALVRVRTSFTFDKGRK